VRIALRDLFQRMHDDGDETKETLD
jgi:hypothetical protein